MKELLRMDAILFYWPLFVGIAIGCGLVRLIRGR
jgi:hypothetical protein